MPIGSRCLLEIAGASELSRTDRFGGGVKAERCWVIRLPARRPVLVRRIPGVQYLTEIQIPLPSKMPSRAILWCGETSESAPAGAYMIPDRRHRSRTTPG